MILYNLYNLLKCYNSQKSIYVQILDKELKPKNYEIYLTEYEQRENILYLYVTDKEQKQKTTVKDLIEIIDNHDKDFIVNYQKQCMILDKNLNKLWITDIENYVDCFIITTRKNYQEGE